MVGTADPLRSLTLGCSKWTDDEQGSMPAVTAVFVTDTAGARIDLASDEARAGLDAVDNPLLDAFADSLDIHKASAPVAAVAARTWVFRDREIGVTLLKQVRPTEVCCKSEDMVSAWWRSLP